MWVVNYAVRQQFSCLVWSPIGFADSHNLDSRCGSLLFTTISVHSVNIETCCYKLFFVLRIRFAAHHTIIANILPPKGRGAPLASPSRTTQITGRESYLIPTEFV